MEGRCFFKVNWHFHYLKNSNYFEIDGLKTSWKPAVRYVPIYFPCKGSKWNPQFDLSWLFTCVETRVNPMRGFPEISNERKRGGIIGLIVFSCGNSWKVLVRFPPSFQCRKSRWNRCVDCFQVWKPSENHIVVSQKWKLRGNYWCHDSKWFPAGFHFWETAFFTQCINCSLEEREHIKCLNYWIFKTIWLQFR